MRKVPITSPVLHCLFTKVNPRMLRPFFSRNAKPFFFKFCQIRFLLPNVIFIFQSTDESDCDRGFEESLELILKTIEDQGPFDGLMGFSQGACLAAILCLRLQQEKQAHFKFCMLFAPFMSPCSKHRGYYNENEKVPFFKKYSFHDIIQFSLF